MGKDELWHLYCRAGNLAQRHAIDTLCLGTHGRSMADIETEDSFMASRMGWPDDETGKRIMRVMVHHKEHYVPENGLYIMGVNVYHLGFMDGQRAERAKRRRQEQWQGRK